MVGVLLGCAPFLRVRPGVTAGVGKGGPKRGRSPGFPLEEQQQHESSAAQRAEDGAAEGEEAEAGLLEADAARSSGAVGGAVMERQRSLRDEDPSAAFLTSQEEAATKIQAAFRGYCTRRGLRRAFSEPSHACPALGPPGTP